MGYRRKEVYLGIEESYEALGTYDLCICAPVKCRRGKGERKLVKIRNIKRSWVHMTAG